MSRSKIQVLIVDDSPLDRELLIEIFEAEPDFEVAGQAAESSTDRAARVELIAIGASTGGVAAIQAVLEALPVDGLPAVVITQHIPAGFSESFATPLDLQLEMNVQQASDGLAIEPGYVYIAPGGASSRSMRRAGASSVASRRTLA